MPIEIAKIKLPHVHRITTLEQTALVYHRVPGLEGNIAQDLGRDSVRLQIEGIFYGPKAAEDLDALRNIYKKREAVDFLADVVGQAYFGKVMLDRFEVAEVSGEPEQYRYVLTVVEYVQPPSPAAKVAAPKIKASLQAQAKTFMKVASLADSLEGGNIPEISNPTEPLKQATTQITNASKAIEGVTSVLKSLFSIRVETPEPPAMEADAKSTTSKDAKKQAIPKDEDGQKTPPETDEEDEKPLIDKPLKWVKADSDDDKKIVHKADNAKKTVHKADDDKKLRA